MTNKGKTRRKDPIFSLFDPEKDNPKDQIRADIVIIIVSLAFSYWMFMTAVTNYLREPSAGRFIMGLPMVIAALLAAKGIVDRTRQIIRIVREKQ